MPLDTMNDVPDIPDIAVLFYKKIIEEEFYNNRKGERDQVQSEMREKLTNIKDELMELKRRNEDAEDIEKLEIDDFCMDLSLKKDIEDQGYQQCDLIRKNAHHKNLEQEILHKKIQFLTYSKMEKQLLTTTGLVSNIIVFNFPLRKRNPQEKFKLSKIKELRKMEIHEKEWRNEKTQEHEELIPLRQIIKKPENYIVNPKPGVQDLILIPHEKKEEERQQMKMMAQQLSVGKDAKGAGGMPGMPAGMRERPGRQRRIRRNKQKKTAGGIGSMSVGGDQSAQEEGGALKQAEYKMSQQEVEEWDMLYGSLELFTNNRKINQVFMVKNIIFNIKMVFNKEFEWFVLFRNKQLDAINEKNQKIRDI